MMQTIFRFIKKYQWPLASGFLIGLTYIPFPPWAVTFGYAPLWISIIKKNFSLKETFIAGWITQFVLTLIGFHWIAYTAHEYGGFPWSLSVITLILFSAFIHLYIPLSVTVAMWLRKQCQLSPLSTLLVCALGISLLERIWPSIFQWNLAYGLLWNQWPIYQWADCFGFLGLSTLLFLSNAFVAFSFLVPQKKWVLGLVAAIFLALNLTGNLQKTPWNATDSELRILAVQANIGNMEKVQAEKGFGFQDFITEKFLTLSREGVEKNPDTDLLIWPETAIPYYMDSNFSQHRYPRLIREGLSSLKKPLISGAYSKDVTIADRDRSVFNALFLFDNQGQVADRPYRKTHLLAFGEYLPLSETFPILLKWLPFIANFGRGQGPQILTWKKSENENVFFGGQVCYEGLYPGFSRGLATQKAQILVNVTNDSWFGTTSEPYQHMIMTFARAIETRRPLMRSTNTGITSAILANGDFLQTSPLHTSWTGQFTIKYLKSPPQTFYVLYGHWDWILWLAILVFLLIRGSLRARTSQP